MRVPLPLAGLCLALAGLLGACSHVPLGSLPKLAQIDLGATDVRVLRAAVRVPSTLRITGARMRVVMVVGESYRVEQTYSLSETSEPDGRASLPSDGPSSRVQVFGLSPADAARLQALREEGFRLGARTKQRGSLRIDLQPSVCRTGELGPEKLLVSTYLRSAETGPAFVPLTRDVDLRSLRREDDVGSIPPCP